MSPIKRRTFIQGSLSTGTIGAAWAVGLLAPEAILAEWPKSVFAAKDVPTVLKGLYGTDVKENSPQIHIKAPEIAENGSLVPITIDTSLTGVTQIALFATVNPLPLVADFNLTENTMPYVSTRIKMSKTGEIVVVIKANDKLYSASKEVKVTTGGCGG